MADKDTVKGKLQANLVEFNTLVRQLFGLIADGKLASEQHGATLSAVVDKLVERQKEIDQLTETAVLMRSRQKEIDKINTEVDRRTQEITDLQLRLQDAEKTLEVAVYNGKQKLESIKQASRGAVAPDELIRYAHRISQASSTVSPVGWQPSDPRRPYPVDSEMRAGWLGRLSSNQPEKGVVPANPTEKKKMQQDVVPVVPTSGTKAVISARLNTGGGFNPFTSDSQTFQSMTFEDAEIMSEDSSPSSSDEV